MSTACPKYLFKVTDPSFLALFQLRWGVFSIATHSSPVLSAAGFSHVILQTVLKMLNWFHFALYATNDTHLNFEKLFKTSQNKGNMCQVFGWKPPCHMTGFKHRSFSKLSHSSASSRCAASVAFCALHWLLPVALKQAVANQCLERWKS